MDVPRNPRPEDAPALKRLWREAFGDPAEYVDFFFSRCFTPERCLAVMQDGEAAAALYLVPYLLPSGRRGSYIYAGAAGNAFRRRGLYRAVMDEALRRADGRGEALCLMSEPYLRPFYRSLGFTGTLSCARLRLPADGAALPADFTELTAAEYAPMRRARFPGAATVLWQERELAYALDEARFCGGFALKIRCGALEGAVIGSAKDGVLSLSETTFTAQELQTLAPTLCARFGASSVEAALPADELPGAAPELCAMTRPASEDGWAGLTLL
jgi:GNAT superfamily N-acetyltransferase